MKTNLGFKEELNKEQLRAVIETEGPMLIIAGAGTGKTRVIISRIVHLIENKGINPENILALTFSKKAADDMAKRLNKRIGSLGKDITVTTFHGFCYQILREHAFHIGLPPSFYLIDEVEEWIFIRNILPELKLEYYLNLSNPSDIINGIIRFISRAKDELVSYEDYEDYVKEKEKRMNPDNEDDMIEMKREREVARIYRTIQMRMIKEGYLDFGDQIFYTVELFKKRPNILKEYQNRFHYIVVDEFQDTNFAQIKLVHLLTQLHGNICVVGDDDQAIYRFRGASFAAFRIFEELFPNLKMLKLTQNYRSTKNILKVADTLIKNNGEDRYDPEKDLWTENKEGKKVFVSIAKSFDDEAFWIAQKIKELINKKVNPSEIAVLYRAHNHKEKLVDLLTHFRIPITIKGGIGLFELKEVRDIITFMKAIYNPKDKIAIFTLLGSAYAELKPNELLYLSKEADLRSLDLWETLNNIEILEPLSSDAKERIANLRKLITEMIPLSVDTKISYFFQQLMEKTAILKQYIFNPSKESQQKASNIINFYRFILEFEENHLINDLGSFLEYVERYIEAGGNSEYDRFDSDEEGVQFMTVHAAKGLEFPYVFLISMTNDRFPTRKRNEPIPFPDELYKEKLPKGDFHLEEERRLCYVAFTRAKKFLYISGVEKDRKRLSRFIEEILKEPKYLVVEEVPSQTEYPFLPAELEDKTTLEKDKLIYSLVRRIVSISDNHDDIKNFFIKSIEDILKIMEYSIPKEKGEIIEEIRKKIEDSFDIRLKKPLITIYEHERKKKEKEILIESPLTLSYSHIEAYQECPLKYKFLYIYHIPSKETAPLAFGTHIHQVLHKFFSLIKQGEKPDLNILLEIYHSGWETTKYMDKYQEEEYKKAGEFQLISFFEKNKENFTPPLHLEKRFDFEIENVIVTGAIDRIDKIEGNRVEVIDYKTGKPKGPSYVKKSLQLSIYALAVKELFGYKPELLSFYYLTPNKKISTTRTEEELLETKKVILNVADQINKQIFEPKKGFYCNWCDYRWLCEDSFYNNYNNIEK